jgi:hypothetical protein
MTGLAPASHWFERPAAQLLSVHRQLKAARLGLAPRSPRLTGAPLTLADLAIKVVGHLGNAPSCLPVPSQADFFLPHARWRMAEGFHPKPLPRFYLFSRQGTTTQCFTIHKVVIPARIALAASSFAGKRSCSAELRDSLVETVEIASTTACLQGRLAPQVHAPPKCCRQELHPHLSS